MRMKPTDAGAALASLWPTYRRFSSYARPDRLAIVLTVVAILGIAVSNTAMIWLIGKPFTLLHEGRYPEVRQALGLFALVVLLNQAFHYLTTVSVSRIGLRFIGRVRAALYTHLLALSFPGSAQYPKGDLLARLSSDVDKVQDMVLELPFFLVSHVFTLAFYIGMLFWIDWQLALLALSVTPLFLVHQRFFGARKRRVAQEFYRCSGRLLAFEEESLGNLRGISSFGAESRFAEAHVNTYEQARRWAMAERRLNAAFGGSLSLLIYLGGVGIVFAGVYAIQSGSFSVGHVVSFLLYLGYLSVPLRGFAQAPFQAQGDLAAAERVLGVLDLSAAVIESPAARDLQVAHGHIAFRKVSFDYPRGACVFHNIDFDIKGGETVALVGPSGSGKSTLARLLLRFYDPTSGAILVDGMDLRQVTIQSLRRNIAIVWQEPLLVNDTIRANLRCAAPEATDEELIAACAASHAWEFIQELPAGLDTTIGAGGVELSAGQRQRLAIAQALLRNAPILIMDEASSALDSRAEQLVVSALEKLRQGRTTLIIAHRYSSIRSADRIIYCNGDGSVTTGRHADLIALHPGYMKAVEWQTASPVAALSEVSPGEAGLSPVIG
jgi:ABC-type multidrug transport system fused ATPase/permease subunit